MARFELRLPKEAKAELATKAKTSGITTSELVRQSIKRTHTWTIADKKSIAQFTHEISRIGNNLNQIARWCNRYKTDADTVQVTSHLLAINRELKKCISSFYHMDRDHAKKP